MWTLVFHSNIIRYAQIILSKLRIIIINIIVLIIVIVLASIFYQKNNMHVLREKYS